MIETDLTKVMDPHKCFDIIISLCNSILLDGRDRTAVQLPDLSADDWEKLLSVASVHGMLPSLMQVFEGRQIEDKDFRRQVVKKFASVQKNKLNFRNRLLTVRELAAMFAEDGIDMMVFKGVATAQLYPKPEWRVFSDIDFYLYGRCLDGNAAMERHGVKSRPFYHHNTEATLHGILLENHYDFAERLNHHQNLIVDDELKLLAKEEGKSLKASFLGSDVGNVYVMTPTMNAIFLMRHMSAHFGSEAVALRMLYDWALFLKAHAKDVDWVRVKRVYDASGMTEFVGLVLEILRAHLGADLSAVPIQPIANEKTERFWRSIVAPPAVNPHKKNSLTYLLYETKTFMGNKWKHDIAYPGESYLMLSLRYAWSVLKRKTGLLKLKTE